MKVEIIDKIENKFYPVINELQTLNQRNKTLKLIFETKKDLHSFRSGLSIQMKKSKCPYKIKAWTEGTTLFINAIPNEEPNDETN